MRPASKMLAAVLAIVAAALLIVALVALLLAAWAWAMVLRRHDSRGADALLAELVHQPEQATQLLTRAGFPASRIPVFKDAQTFWARALEEARKGVLPGGVRPILEQAAAMYPHNPALAGYR